MIGIPFHQLSDDMSNEDWAKNMWSKELDEKIRNEHKT